MKYLFAFGAYLFTPLLVRAQQPRNFRELVDILLNIIDVLVLLIFALTVVVLMWGVIQAWILNAGDEAAIERGKKVVLVGIIVLTITAGIWGILYILRYSLFGI